MTISDKDLFLAILSMDSYNRGYGAGITLPETSVIGNAVILDTPSSIDQDSWVAAGFYAAAYDTNSWGTVISYRGTDNVGLLTAVGGGTDFWSGWVTGAGLVQQGQQADLALRFYNTVTGNDPLSNTSCNATLTGHSLGGGLAGFVALNDSHECGRVAV